MKHCSYILAASTKLKCNTRIRSLCHPNSGSSQTKFTICESQKKRARLLKAGNAIQTNHHYTSVTSPPKKKQEARSLKAASYIPRSFIALTLKTLMKVRAWAPYCRFVWALRLVMAFRFCTPTFLHCTRFLSVLQRSVSNKSSACFGHGSLHTPHRFLNHRCPWRRLEIILSPANKD